MSVFWEKVVSIWSVILEKVVCIWSVILTFCVTDCSWHCNTGQHVGQQCWSRLCCLHQHFSYILPTLYCHNCHCTLIWHQILEMKAIQRIDVKRPMLGKCWPTISNLFDIFGQHLPNIQHFCQRQQAQHVGQMLAKCWACLRCVSFRYLKSQIMGEQGIRWQNVNFGAKKNG